MVSDSGTVTYGDITISFRTNADRTHIQVSDNLEPSTLRLDKSIPNLAFFRAMAVFFWENSGNNMTAQEYEQLCTEAGCDEFRWLP